MCGLAGFAREMLATYAAEAGAWSKSNSPAKVPCPSRAWTIAPGPCCSRLRSPDLVGMNLHVRVVQIDARVGDGSLRVHRGRGAAREIDVSVERSATALPAGISPRAYDGLLAISFLTV